MDKNTEAIIQKRFEYYVNRKRYNQEICAPGSHDESYSSGELREAERWLCSFGVGLDYERIGRMIRGEQKVLAFCDEENK